MTRALYRFAQAKGRSDRGDQALDLGIALEMLLLNSEHKGQELPGQLNLHFRLRGAWFLAKDASERIELYKIFGRIYALRSQLAHNGFSKDLEEIEYQDSEKMTLSHISTAERLIQKLIIEGQPDNWANVILDT
jgi:hypothetical protein